MSNAYHFDGRLAAAPVVTRPSADLTVCKFTLIRNERINGDEGKERKERKVQIQFTAFNGLANTIAEHCLEGDQLIVTARIENNNYTVNEEIEYGFNFILTEFSFGAPGAKKREALANRSQD